MLFKCSSEKEESLCARKYCRHTPVHLYTWMKKRKSSSARLRLLTMLQRACSVKVTTNFTRCDNKLNMRTPQNSTRIARQSMSASRCGMHSNFRNCSETKQAYTNYCRVCLNARNKERSGSRPAVRMHHMRRCRHSMWHCRVKAVCSQRFRGNTVSAFD